MHPAEEEIEEVVHHYAKSPRQCNVIFGVTVLAIFIWIGWYMTRDSCHAGPSISRFWGLYTTNSIPVDCIQVPSPWWTVTHSKGTMRYIVEE